MNRLPMWMPVFGFGWISGFLMGLMMTAVVAVAYHEHGAPGWSPQPTPQGMMPDNWSGSMEQYRNRENLQQTRPLVGKSPC